MLMYLRVAVASIRRNGQRIGSAYGEKPGSWRLTGRSRPPEAAQDCVHPREFRVLRASRETATTSRLHMGRNMRVILAVVMILSGVQMAAAETVRLYAAGSLRAAMSDMTKAFEAQQGGATKVETVTGASGLLRERIEGGETAHVFASADMGHPRRLAEAGRAAGPVAIFARNQLCALVKPGLAVTTDTLLDRMLAAEIKLGTSTPRADPSGDYAFALFAKADAVKSGARAALEAKALQLTGGPNSERAPEGRGLYAWVMDTGRADIFLTYCTNAVAAKAESGALSIVDIPKALNVGADYGLIVLKGSPEPAERLARFIRSPDGQAILAKHGFGPGDAP